MEEATLRSLLEKVSTGEISVEEAVSSLRDLPFADLGFAKIDHHREVRLGVTESVYGPGKSPKQVAAIVSELLSGSDGPVIVTRATDEQYQAVIRRAPDARLDALSGLMVVRGRSGEPAGLVAVASAGTSDLAVAEEAALTCEALGMKVERLPDVGVAGLHRLLYSHKELAGADVVIVVAGMDGALASIVGGLVAAPVIAVPTSVGYGAGAGGIAPLLTMLNSCAPGVAVVNIDNGFGAAAVAARILRARA